MAHSYRDLIVWQRAVDLVVELYRLLATFPKHWMYALADQVRRRAVSAPSNIAEGQGRLSRKEFRHFLGHARGSLLEMETQLLIAHRLGCIREEQRARIMELSGEVGRLLHRLIQSISDEPCMAAETSQPTS
ncbi:MAG: four helix bundle protein [Terriglobales bacterium]